MGMGTCLGRYFMERWICLQVHDNPNNTTCLIDNYNVQLSSYPAAPAILWNMLVHACCYVVHTVHTSPVDSKICTTY